MATSSMATGGGVSGASLWHAFLSANRPSSLSKWQMVEKAAVLGFIIMAINKLRKVKLQHLISVSEHSEHRQRRTPAAAVWRIAEGRTERGKRCREAQMSVTSE